MRWKGIIFDRDGTLFDSLPVILSSFNYGIEPFTEKRPSDAEWFAAFGPHEPEVLGAFIPSDKKEEAYRRFYSYYTEHSYEITLFSGLEDLLKRLKERGIKLMVFTGGGWESTRFCLERGKILSFFDEIITGEKVKHPKPHPEGILSLMALQNLTGAETLVLGDAPADIEAGKAAGAFTALARWSNVPQHGEFRVEPDFVFHTIPQFEKFVFTDSIRRKK